MALKYHRTTLLIPHEIHVALKKAAKDGGITKSKYILRLIINALLRQGHIIIDDRAVMFEKLHL